MLLYVGGVGVCGCVCNCVRLVHVLCVRIFFLGGLITLQMQDLVEAVFNSCVHQVAIEAHWRLAGLLSLS